MAMMVVVAVVARRWKIEFSNVEFGSFHFSLNFFFIPTAIGNPERTKKVRIEWCIFHLILLLLFRLLFPFLVLSGRFAVLLLLVHLFGYNLVETPIDTWFIYNWLRFSVSVCVCVFRVFWPSIAFIIIIIHRDTHRIFGRNRRCWMEIERKKSCSLCSIF